MLEKMPVTFRFKDSNRFLKVTILTEEMREDEGASHLRRSLEKSILVGGFNPLEKY